MLFADNAAGRWCDKSRPAGRRKMRIEAAGYSIVLHVHDEIVAEVPEGFGSTEEFAHIMTRAPSWALTLPIAAKAWAGLRFS